MAKPLLQLSCTHAVLRSHRPVPVPPAPPLYRTHPRKVRERERGEEPGPQAGLGSEEGLATRQYMVPHCTMRQDRERQGVRVAVGTRSWLGRARNEEE